MELVPEVSARGATVDREDGVEDCVMLSPNLEALEAADRIKFLVLETRLSSNSSLTTRRISSSAMLLSQ